MSETLDLLDYRRRVSAIYAEVRGRPFGPDAWSSWTVARNVLFKTHPQSPIEDQDGFGGLPYFEYDPHLRTKGRFTPTPPAPWGEFDRIGLVEFAHNGEEQHLPIYWLRAYGGGLFLPFRDETSGKETYGGGRYLWDTAKGADLGHFGEDLILDFNYAYHPSCVHSSRWTCPLAEPQSRLPLPIAVGERLSEGPANP